MQVAFGSRLRRVAVATAIPVAAVLVFATSVFAWTPPTIKVTCIPGKNAFNLKMTATDSDTGDYSTATSHKLAFTLNDQPVDFHQDVTWSWDTSNPDKTQVIFDQGIIADTENPDVNGNWTVSFVGIDDKGLQNIPFTVSGCTAPTPSPSPSPSHSPSPTPSPTPTPSGQGQGTPGLPNTGAARS